MLRSLRERVRGGEEPGADRRAAIPPGVAVVTAFLLGLWAFLVVTNGPVRVAVDGSPVTVDPLESDWGGLPVLVVSIVGLLAAWGLLLGRFWGYVGSLVTAAIGAVLAYAMVTSGYPYRFPTPHFWTLVLVALVVCVAYLVFAHERVLVDWVAKHESR